MHRVRRSVFVRSFLLPFALLIWLAACTKWVPLKPPVEQAIAESKPGTVRVTLADGGLVTVKEPRVSRDSLVGLCEQPSYWESGKLERDARSAGIPLEAVERIEEQRSNPVATVGLVLGITFVVLAIAAAVAGPMDLGGDWFCIGDDCSSQ